MASLLKNKVKHHRITPYGNQGTINPDDVIDFYLPQYGFLELESLLMYFDVTFNTSNAGATQHAFPRDAECVIQTLEVFVNGVMVNNIQNYNQLFRILSDYAFDGDSLLSRYAMRNTLFNGSIALATAANAGGTYACGKWLGLFGEQGVIDLSKNSIHIRITVSPRHIIISPNAANSFSLSNVYLTAKYYENYTGEVKNQITFADFKSILQHNPTSTQETYLKLFTKNVDYVIGTLLASNFRTIFNVISANQFTSNFFNRANTVSNISSWNFKVNQHPIFNYAPRGLEGLVCIKDVFPEGVNNQMLAATAGFSSFFTNRFICAANVGFINQDPEEVELSFNTTEVVGSNVANFSLLIAKIDNTIPLNV